MKADSQADLESKIENSDCPEDTSPETIWYQLKSAILQISEGVLGFTTKKNKDWSDENKQEIQELLAKKRSSNQAHLAQPSCPVRRTAFRVIYSPSFERYKMSGGRISQTEISNIQTEVTTEAYTGQCMARLTVSRVPCPVQMGKCFLQTRTPFLIVGLSSSNLSLALIVSSRTQQFSVSPSNHSKQNWMNYPLGMQ